MLSRSTSPTIEFLTAVFPCLSIDEYCLKAIAALRPSGIPEIVGDDADSARSRAIVRGLIVLLPDVGRAFLFTLDSSGAIARSQIDLSRPAEDPSELLPYLAPLAGSQCHPVTSGSQLIGLCGETASEPSADAGCSGEWTALVQATLPQVYEQEASFLRRKLEAMAEFAAGAGHEINNPAATIVGRAGQLLRQETDPERRRHLATIGAQAYRIRDMIGDAMLFARPPRPELRTIVVGEAIEEAVASLNPRLAEKSVKIDISFSAAVAVSIPADPAQLQALLCEILSNAIQASPASSRIDVVIRTETFVEGCYVEIAVRDRGPGLSAIEREHLFDPFFSGRQAGRGLGFGLPKAWQIARQHGGTLTVWEEGGDERGITFIVRLPADRPTAP